MCIRDRLKQLERSNIDSSPQTAFAFAETKAQEDQALEKTQNDLEDALKALDPDDLSAREALQLIYKLKSIMK